MLQSSSSEWNFVLTSMGTRAQVASCPSQTKACPIFADDSWRPGSNEPQPAAADYECVAVLRDLDNCGGCASTGEGTACTSTEGVRGASCVQGRCEISKSRSVLVIYLNADLKPSRAVSCSEGYTLTFSLDHGRGGRKHGRNARASVKKACVKQNRHPRITL